MKNSIINNLDIIDFAKNSEAFDIEIFKNKECGIVKVYGYDNQPALFLKEVDTFDTETLKLIAKIQHDCWNFQKVLFLYVYTKTEIRIYNCSEKPFEIFKEKDDINLGNLSFNNNQIYETFHPERKLKHLFFNFSNN